MASAKALGAWRAWLLFSVLLGLGSLPGDECARMATPMEPVSFTIEVSGRLVDGYIYREREREREKGAAMARLGRGGGKCRWHDFGCLFSTSNIITMCTILLARGTVGPHHFLHVFRPSAIKMGDRRILCIMVIITLLRC